MKTRILHHCETQTYELVQVLGTYTSRREAELVQLLAGSVIRVRWRGHLCYARLCPSCGRPGFVPVEARGALAYINRPNWECVTCQRERDAAQRAQLALGMALA